MNNIFRRFSYIFLHPIFCLLLHRFSSVSSVCGIYVIRGVFVQKYELRLTIRKSWTRGRTWNTAWMFVFKQFTIFTPFLRFYNRFHPFFANISLSFDYLPFFWRFGRSILTISLAFFFSFSIFDNLQVFPRFRPLLAFFLFVVREVFVQKNKLRLTIRKNKYDKSRISQPRTPPAGLVTTSPPIRSGWSFPPSLP